ncbi:MAG: hypothetical protein HYS26_00765 [Candidatus Kaiserbacteria bacterium]|nr:MAG: hypothetical protein HYS26_00765 [Candidatus Kaiserbacteria bacterium]
MPKPLDYDRMHEGVWKAGAAVRQWFAGKMPAEGSLEEMSRAELHLRDASLPRTTAVLHAIMVFARLEHRGQHPAIQKRWIDAALDSQFQSA